MSKYLDRPEGNEEGDISDDENYVYVKSDCHEEEDGSHDDNDSTSDST